MNERISQTQNLLRIAEQMIRRAGCVLYSDKFERSIPFLEIEFYR